MTFELRIYALLKIIIFKLLRTIYKSQPNNRKGCTNADKRSNNKMKKVSLTHRDDFFYSIKDSFFRATNDIFTAHEHLVAMTISNNCSKAN